MIVRIKAYVRGGPSKHSKLKRPYTVQCSKSDGYRRLSEQSYRKSPCYNCHRTGMVSKPSPGPLRGHKSGVSGVQRPCDCRYPIRSSQGPMKRANSTLLWLTSYHSTHSTGGCYLQSLLTPIMRGRRRKHSCSRARLACQTLDLERHREATNRQAG